MLGGMSTGPTSPQHHSPVSLKTSGSMTTTGPDTSRSGSYRPGTVELVINLRDDKLRIYDRGRLGVCERFSGAIVSG